MSEACSTATIESAFAMIALVMSVFLLMVSSVGFSATVGYAFQEPKRVYDEDGFLLVVPKLQDAVFMRGLIARMAIVSGLYAMTLAAGTLSYEGVRSGSVRAKEVCEANRE